MDTQTLTFTLERETKNTLGMPSTLMGSRPLYAQKGLLGNVSPKQLTVIIDADQEQDG
jgi:hypothetical protein